MNKKKLYSAWFLVPTLLVFGTLFLLPMATSFFFSLTVWNLRDFTFVGLENFKMFLKEGSLNIGIRNTLVYALCGCSMKLVLAFFIAVFLNSGIRSKHLLRAVVFFPNLMSTVAVGITFKALMHPSKGLFNRVLELMGLARVDWLGNPDLALFSVVGTDVWKGVGVATVIYIAGMQAIDKTYYEAAAIDGATGAQRLLYLTLPLCRPAMHSVMILAFIGGLRSFDLIWSMTGGGPGFATDVLASVIYKQYAEGFYGLSTAGNVIMLGLIMLLAFPLQKFLLSREAD